MRVELTTAIALLISFPLFLVYIWHVFYNYQWKKHSTDEVLQQCPFCTHVFYLILNNDSIWICPQCKSLVQKDDQNSERKVERG